MESLTHYSAILKNLRQQVEELTSAGLSLANLFKKEATLLNRMDEVSRLNTLQTDIRQQFDLAKWNEDSASYSQSQADLTSSLIRLAVGGTIKMVSKNRKLSSFSDVLLTGATDKQRPFGTVLVCIGLKGLPDDVRVVCISKLARESNSPESEVIKKIQERGCLLFDEKVFSLLIDRLVDDVREGWLHLPVSRETLSQVILSSKLNPVTQ